GLALLDKAETLVRALDDRVRLGQVLAEMTQVRRITGDPDGAMLAGQQALALAAEFGDSALQVQASFRLGQVYYAIGNFGRAVELLRRNVEVAGRESGTPSTEWRLHAPAGGGRHFGQVRAFHAGRRHAGEALPL